MTSTSMSAETARLTALRLQEEKDIQEAVRQSLVTVEKEGYSFKPTHRSHDNMPTFAERLPRAKICVIGANYGKLDSERWSQIDPYYIGIEGTRYEPDLIPDNPIRAFDWNSAPFVLSHIFSDGPLKGKLFDSVIIDRSTHHLSGRTK